MIRKLSVSIKNRFFFFKYAGMENCTLNFQQKKNGEMGIFFFSIFFYFMGADGDENLKKNLAWP